jgi:hypothetical protein
VSEQIDAFFAVWRARNIMADKLQGCARRLADHFFIIDYQYSCHTGPRIDPVS